MLIFVRILELLSCFSKQNFQDTCTPQRGTETSPVCFGSVCSYDIQMRCVLPGRHWKVVYVCKNICRGKEFLDGCIALRILELNEVELKYLKRSRK